MFLTVTCNISYAGQEPAAQLENTKTDQSHTIRIDKKTDDLFSTPIRFNIPSQKLSKAILRFGEQADISVLIQHEAGELTTDGLIGDYSPLNGLEQLLRGNELEIEKAGNGFVIMQKPQKFQQQTVAQVSNKQIRGNPAIGAIFLSSSVPATAQTDEIAIEQIVVTGSLIRRTEGFTSASPMVQITAQDLQDQGTVTMAEVVNNMTYNMGTGLTNRNTGGDHTTRINLRGLGSRATLMLLDGKRIADDNVQLLVPMIAIERMDIVVDGAAATYGTDAVAGVVNLIPYSRFEGFEVEVFSEDTERDDPFWERQVSILAGHSIGDSISLGGAASFKRTNPMDQVSRPGYLAGLRTNSLSNPASHQVPQRDDNGDLTGVVASTVDPLCGTGPQVPEVNGYPFGILDPSGEECLLEWTSDRNLRNTRIHSQFYGKATYDVNPGFTISSAISFSRSDVESQEYSSFPVQNESALPLVRGELPGNPFRAVSGDGRELFAVPSRDAGGNIIMDGYNRPLPQRGSDGNVMLASNRFSPIGSDPLGGVPFNEDTKLQGWEPFGKFGGSVCPQVMYDRTKKITGRDDLCLNYRNFDQRLWRYDLDAEFDVPGLEGWEGRAFYTYSSFNDVSRRHKHMSRSALEQGLNCDVVTDVISCFNPFAATIDSPFNTPQHVADSIMTNDRQNVENILQTFDIHFNGTIPLGDFELPGGIIGAAIGYQRRDENQKIIPAASSISGDGLLTSQEFPRDQGRTVDASFAELLLPILPELEMGFNIRTEEFSTGQDDTITKLGIAYSPFDWIALRGTTGEAFVAPSMTQLDSPETCGLSGVEDPFTGTQGFVASCSTGNPNLVSESSDVTSIGFDLSPIEGLTLSATWSEVDFTDRIVNTNGQVILDLDFNRFKEATGFTATAANPYPTRDVMRAWNANPASSERITRTPDTIQIIDQVDTGSTNAANVIVKSVDMNLNYFKPFRDWGTFVLNIDATHTLNFEYQQTILDDVIEGAGKANIRTRTAPAVAEWRSNASLSWSLGPHRANLTARYISAVDYDGPQFEFTAVLPGSTWRQVDTIRPWTSMDMFYTYAAEDLPVFGGDGTLSIGLRNAFDREAQKSPGVGGHVGELQNPMGRMLYGRLNLRF